MQVLVQRREVDHVEGQLLEVEGARDLLVGQVPLRHEELLVDAELVGHLHAGDASNLLGQDSHILQEGLQLRDCVRLDLLLEQRYRLVDRLAEPVV